jgi:hypothetical protein
MQRADEDVLMMEALAQTPDIHVSDRHKIMLQVDRTTNYHAFLVSFQ